MDHLAKLTDLAGLFGVTFLAAWAGGWAAFSAERKTRDQKEWDARISATNRAIFKIAQIYEVYGNLREFFIRGSETRNDPDRALKMNSPQPGMLSAIKFNFDELSFLLDMPGSTDMSVVMDLMRLEWRYQVLTATVDLRARAADDLHRIMRQRPLANLQPGGAAMFYRQEYDKATALTDQLIDLVSDGLEHTKDVNQKFQSTLRLRFPGQSFLQINFASPTVTS